MFFARKMCKIKCVNFATFLQNLATKLRLAILTFVYHIFYKFNNIKNENTYADHKRRNTVDCIFV